MKENESAKEFMDTLEDIESLLLDIIIATKKLRRIIEKELEAM